ncbi:UV DNA damage repair endonuclease UvsE [Desulfosporosinus hippei]|uniref:UV DNA damage endonuclease n=1 Tax=Desulfosporosinus hippei DSM 8344 TaxID=1121419 RepID=A0A1G8DS67_9FIRM|nr:UV DNA damage repair endonuclease UvsE [Desulfosporosinus hippei]SDH60468.1 UV DNA damage endonuclease [Desulfosporosinus hippei DSM 8344]
MSIGYASLTTGVPDTKIKSCILKNASYNKLLGLIDHNLKSLETMIDYNIENSIALFRISSDLIPFGSSPVNNLLWWEIFCDRIHQIGEKIKNSGMRVSMHPGYTILNSPNEVVVTRTIEDLNYHNRVLDSLGVNSMHKIVLHIGGVYNDKKLATKRFIDNYWRLSDSVRQRIVLENDDKSYNIHDVLEIGARLNTPVIFDNLHHQINCFNDQFDDYYWINTCRKTWQEKDGYQKIHYSQQHPLKKPGSHSITIGIGEFMRFYQNLERKDLDIMLEVKDKNLSALKCIHCLFPTNKASILEREWIKYKYMVLEKSPDIFDKIQHSLRSPREYPIISFYTDIEAALQNEYVIENSLNAATHIWEFLNSISTEKDNSSFSKVLKSFKLGKTSLTTIKNFLWRFAVKYEDESILGSYYFIQ